MEEQANLDQTERGEKGFGSTGTNELKNELVQEKSGQKNEFGENEVGTVKLLYSHEELEALKNPVVTEKIAVIANPRFWQFENCSSSFSFKGDEKWKSKYCTLRIYRPVACSMKVKRLVNHAKLPV